MSRQIVVEADTRIEFEQNMTEAQKERFVEGLIQAVKTTVAGYINDKKPYAVTNSSVEMHCYEKQCLLKRLEARKQ